MDDNEIHKMNEKILYKLYCDVGDYYFDRQLLINYEHKLNESEINEIINNKIIKTLNNIINNKIQGTIRPPW